jgi:hypothetical protein
MSEPVAFRRGCDLEPEASDIACESCDAVAGSREEAAAVGWQIDPPVCIDCLRWTPVQTAGDCCMSGA